MLKWARKNYTHCPWDETACEQAAHNGHVDILWYLYSNHAPYNTAMGIHENCRDFFDEFRKDWKSGTFALLNQNIKG